MREPISMMRASAPRLPVFADALRATWRDLASRDESLAAEFQTHRFGGTDADRAAGVAWIGKRIDPLPDIERVMVTRAVQRLLNSFV